MGYSLHFCCLDNDNKLINNLILNSNNPVEKISSGYCQAAKSIGELTLVSCCIGPGFDLKYFELLRNINHTSRLDKAINDLFNAIIFFYNFRIFLLDLKIDFINL